MYPKFAKTAAKVAAVGAVVAASGLGFAQAALAVPVAGAVDVPCSVAALASAISGNAGGETLSLAKFCTYQLTSALPDITEDLTIDGNGGAIERSYATDTPDFRIFYVPDDVDFVLNQVNLRNGAAGDGGGPVRKAVSAVQAGLRRMGGPGRKAESFIRAGSRRSVIRAGSRRKAGFPRADGDNEGGAIYNEEGSVTVNGGTLSDNSADDEGGAIYNDDDGSLTVNGTSFTDNGAQYGGGIANENDATVTGATFTGNEAEYGGGIYNDDSATVVRSDFTKNGAEYGGGMYNDEDSYLAVTGSGFYENQAGAGGGIDNAGCDCDCDDSDLLVTGGAFTGNAAEFAGGGIYNNDDATVTDVTFRLNTSEWGGGIYVDDQTGDTTFALTGGTFSGNTAAEGGAIFNVNDSSVDGATFRLNTADWGGAIYNWEDNTFTFTDSTITGNTATGGGGGIYNQDDGTVTLTTTSVFSNHRDNCEPLNTISGCTD